MSSTSAVELVSAALEAAHATQATLNAFTSLDDERAMARARAIDAGDIMGPLAGMPIGLKDLIDQAGRVTTCGSAFYRHVAQQDATCVTELERAGAVIIGRTGLHEWAFGFSSENPHWGPVRNPWDTTTSAGGSSGGSAAAVAGGITPIAVGTDTGGSVRVPAALCGTFGLKVTHGRVPLDGVFPLVSSIDTVGPLADSIDGLEIAYRAMSGDQSPAEPVTRGLRLGIPQPWYSEAPMDEGIAADFEDTVTSLRELGHEVHAIEMPDVLPNRHIWNAIAEEVRQVHHDFRSRGEPYGPDVSKRLDDAELVTPEDSEAARRWQEMIRARFSDALSTVDFLVTPAVPVRRKVIGVDTIGERHYRAVLSWFSALVNHALLPAIAMPVTATGPPPASIQVIGPPRAEARLISLGRQMEASAVVRFVRATNSTTVGPE